MCGSVSPEPTRTGVQLCQEINDPQEFTSQQDENSLFISGQMGRPVIVSQWADGSFRYFLEQSKCNFHHSALSPLLLLCETDSSQAPGRMTISWGQERRRNPTAISTKRRTRQCNQYVEKSARKKMTDFSFLKLTLPTLSPLYSPCIIISFCQTPSHTKSHSSHYFSILRDLSHCAFFITHVLFLILRNVVLTGGQKLALPTSLAI